MLDCVAFLDPQCIVRGYSDVTLKLPFFNPPNPNHYTSSCMITRTPLPYVTPDTDTILYHLFLFLEVEKNPKDDTPMTHPPMFLSN